MIRLRFLGYEVLELLEHSRSAAERGRPQSPDPELGPGLFLVKDSGIYLVSNGLPPLLDGERKNRVVFAEGFNPNKCADASSWALVLARLDEALGESDFSESISDEGELLTLRPDEALIVEVTEASLRLYVETQTVCKVCGTTLDGRGYCKSSSCAHNNHLQHEKTEDH